MTKCESKFKVAHYLLFSIAREMPGRAFCALAIVGGLLAAWLTNQL